MSFRHKITALAAGTLVVVTATVIGPVGADDGVALARVARELGYTYAYLPYENAVSLYRPGATVVVRPGDAYFSANERREPVYGMIPAYRNNDVYVSRRFVAEIRDLGRRMREDRAVALAESSAPVAMSPSAARAPRGLVSSVSATYDSATDTIVVRGRATPGSLVALDVRATLASSLPVITVDRGSAVTDADGAFVARLGFGTDQFPDSRFVVEAAGLANAANLSAPVPARIR